MSLIAIKQHLTTVRLTSLGNLCTVFGCDADTMRCMLRHWMQKGCVRQCTREPACGSKCFKCPTASVELYEWVGQV